MYVLCMYYVCTMYVLCMYYVCTMYVLCMYYVCTMYVLCMYYVCTMYVLCMGQFFHVLYIYYKNPLHLNHYNSQTINAIDFLFSTLHTTPFLYGKIHFGVLH